MVPKDFEEGFDDGDDIVEDDEFFSYAVIVAGCFAIAFLMCLIAGIVG
jgi:hypothetical protein